MKEKILQAGSDTLGTNERIAVKSQLDELAAEIDDIVDTTEWGGSKMLDGTFTGKSFQVGQAATDTLAFGIAQRPRRGRSRRHSQRPSARAG
jgi:flagellin